MATTGTVKLNLAVYQNGVEQFPKIDEKSFSSKRVEVSNAHEVSAGATDESVPINGTGTIALIIFYVENEADNDKITLKINGDTVGFKLNPIEIRSEDITTLTASNSDADNKVKMSWHMVTT